MTRSAGTAVGLIGCGRWGANILRDLKALACRVVVCDPDADARRLASDRGADGTVADIGSLPSSLDGLVVATPSATHAACVTELLPLGLPVFCEKPLATSATDASRLARQADGRLFVMHKWRYHGGIRKLGEIARSGEIGAVRQVRTRRLQWGQPHDDVDGVWIMAVHDLTIVLEILGYLPEPLAASMSGLAGRADALLGILGEDPSAVIDVSSNWPKNERVQLILGDVGVAYLTDPYEKHVTIARDPGRRTLDKAVAGGEVEHVAVDTEWPLIAELRVFVRHLRGGPRPPTDAAEGALIVEAVCRLRALAGEV